MSKPWTLNFEKLEISTTLIAISRHPKAKPDYGYFMIFLRYIFKILHKKMSSHFKQKWRSDDDFTDSKSNQNLGKSPSRRHAQIKL